MRTSKAIEANTKHGHSIGGRVSRTYVSWQRMLSRCSNPDDPKWPRYGGRGVVVCERWNSFDKFLADMDERPIGTTLDRYPDQDGNYEPGNCRWATDAEQQNNRGDNRRITVDGMTHTLGEWAYFSGKKSSTIRARIDRLGWTPKRALLDPVREGNYGASARRAGRPKAAEGR